MVKGRILLRKEK